MATIKLKNVRLSFASLFKKATFGGEETKYEGTFLIDKETQADQIAEINTAIAAIMKEKKAKLSPDRICFKDGDEIDYDGYAGHMSIKASNAKRPIVIDRDKSPLTEDDGRPYSGCYVNAVLELWFQDNTWGKRVNANLLAVQFAKDGEPFGEGGASVSVDDFDVIDEDDDIF
jgi:co-chaperonin GroES (HSP10)